MPWWPDDPLEVVVGAVLVQGTTWTSVSRVLASLKEQNLLDFRRLSEIDDESLAERIRPVGFHAKKTARLKAIARLFLDRSDGDTEKFFARDVEQVRRELLGISGIGPGTADNILLYAGKVPIYMVDTFTIRLLVRHGIVGAHAKETEIQDLIHRELTPDEEPYGARLFHEFQAFVVRIGRDFCGKTGPKCGECPLQGFLPADGALGVKPLAATQASRPTAQTETAPQPIETLELDDLERQIVEQLDTEPTPIDAVIQATGLPIHVVRAKIAILEMRKILRQVEGNRVRRV